MGLTQRRLRTSLVDRIWEAITLKHKRNEEIGTVVSNKEHSVLLFTFVLFEDHFCDNSLKGTRVVELERKVRKAEFKLLYICRTRHKNGCMRAPPTRREHKGQTSDDTRYKICDVTFHFVNITNVMINIPEKIINISLKYKTN